MTIFEVIRDDHEKVKKILNKLAESSKRAHKTREEQFEQLKEDVLPHMQAEESLFYPFLQEEGEMELALMAEEEHNVAKNLMVDIEETDISDDRWLAKVKVLEEIVLHHIEEEESVIFDKAMELMDDSRATDMAEQFQQMKKEALAEFQ